MDKVMEIMGTIGVILIGVWFIAIIFVDLPGWIALVPLDMMLLYVIYSDRNRSKKKEGERLD